MRFRFLAAGVLLSGSIVSGGGVSAATSPSVQLPAARSGCGVVRLPKPTTLDVLAALRSATTGYRVVFVRQLDRQDPLEIVGIRVQDVGVRPGPGEAIRRGAVQGVRAPAGRYRFCVFSDHPQPVAVPAAGLTRALTMGFSPARSSVWSPPVRTSGVPLRQEVAALHDVHASRTSLVLAAGVVRLDASTPVAWDDGTCLVPQGESCDGGDALYGTRTSMTSGRGTEAGWEWWPNDLLPPGSYRAGMFFRGTQSPSYLRGWVLQADL